MFDGSRNSQEDQGHGGMSQEEPRGHKSHLIANGSSSSLDSDIDLHVSGNSMKQSRSKLLPGYSQDDGKVLKSILNNGFGPIGNQFDMETLYPAASSDSDSELSGYVPLCASDWY